MMENRLFRAGANALRHVRWMARRAAGGQRRVLVETRWRLGDEIMAIPIYEGVKRRYPFCRLTAWCNYPDLVARNPFVDSAVGPELTPNTRDFDAHFVLRGAPRTVFRLDHYASAAGIPTPSMNPRLYYDDWTARQLETGGLSGKKFVVICTGATWETKRWPLAQWRALARTLEADDHTVVQLGDGDERAGAAHDIVGQTSVREAACILRRARLLITCDSGLMHLALAAGTPVLALFGPTDPAILVRGNAPLAVMTNGRACQGCWNHFTGALREGICPLDISPCMGTITVDAVLARTRELLGAGP